MKTGFSLCGNTTQGKPCTGPVRDCSVTTHITNDSIPKLYKRKP